MFQTQRDAEITIGIYKRVPVLWRDEPEENPWGLSFMRMFDMANDSGLFRTRDQLERDGWTLAGNVFVRGGKRMLPLYEAKTDPSLRSSTRLLQQAPRGEPGH